MPTIDYLAIREALKERHPIFDLNAGQAGEYSFGVAGLPFIEFMFDGVLIFKIWFYDAYLELFSMWTHTRQILPVVIIQYDDPTLFDKITAYVGNFDHEDFRA